MKVWKRCIRSLSIACLAALLFPAAASADIGGNDESYTYTVTLYAGNQGSFGGAGGVSISGSGAVTYSDADEIRITGLRYGDRVSFNAQSGMVSLGEDSRYYVRGVRESGRDNDTVGNSSFAVDSDREYVVAYGIRGNMVSYVVNYQDASGNSLMPSQTFYGAVGDRPVVAFQYIEGYQPQAYNLTGTLSENEADNLFTFVYTQIPSGGGETSGTDTGAAAGGTAGTAGTGAAGTAGAGAGTGAADDAAAGETGAEGADAPAGDDTAGTAGTTEDGTADGGEETDEPREIVDIDEEETPLGDFDSVQDSSEREDSAEREDSVESAARPVGNMPVFIGIAIAALIAVIAAVIFVVRSRRK